MADLLEVYKKKNSIDQQRKDLEEPIGKKNLFIICVSFAFQAHWIYKFLHFIFSIFNQ